MEASFQATRPPRRRPLLVFALAATIALGLGSRSASVRIPTILAENAGDALWTVALFLALAFVCPAASTFRLAVAALAGSAAVELSQLVDTPWLAQLRAHPLGRLALGTGWQWLDLARYAAGSLLAALMDLLWLRRRVTPRSG